jgi:hypothetical protein
MKDKPASPDPRWSDPRWDDRVKRIARDGGWLLEDFQLRARLSVWDRRRMGEAILEAEERLAAEPPRHQPTPIATPEQAQEAYARLDSERAAATELGISKTQLRRLLGKD